MIILFKFTYQEADNENKLAPYALYVLGTWPGCLFQTFCFMFLPDNVNAKHDMIYPAGAECQWVEQDKRVLVRGIKAYCCCIFMNGLYRRFWNRKESACFMETWYYGTPWDGLGLSILLPLEHQGWCVSCLACLPFLSSGPGIVGYCGICSSGCPAGGCQGNMMPLCNVPFAPPSLWPQCSLPTVRTSPRTAGSVWPITPRPSTSSFWPATAAMQW